MAVRNQLARLGARTRDSQTVNDVVQTALKQYQEIGTGQADLLLRTLEVTTELSFHYAINAARFLLFTQLQQIVGSAAAAELFLTAVLSGWI